MADAVPPVHALAPDNTAQHLDEVSVASLAPTTYLKVDDVGTTAGYPLARLYPG